MKLKDIFNLDVVTPDEPAEPAPAEPTPAEPAEPAPAEPTPAEPAEPTPAEPTPAEPAPDYITREELRAELKELLNDFQSMNIEKDITGNKPERSIDDVLKSIYEN